MGERGLISRLLAPKYGGYLTFASLASGQESAPGQPTVQQLCSLFRLPSQQRDIRVRPLSVSEDRKKRKNPGTPGQKCCCRLRFRSAQAAVSRDFVQRA